MLYTLLFISSNIPGNVTITCKWCLLFGRLSLCDKPAGHLQTEPCLYWILTQLVYYLYTVNHEKTW